MSLPARVRVNAAFPFPATVQGSGPISVAKNQGIWTVGYSINGLAVQVPTAGQLATDYVPVWDSTVNQFVRVALSSISSSASGNPFYYAKQNGLACDGITDDTAALNALLVTVNNAGGGTIFMNGMALILGQITLPNDGQATLKQNGIRITGSGVNFYGQFIGAPATANSGLDLRFNAPIAKIITLGTGVLEIDHITIKNGGADSAPFILTTHTTLYVHDNAISGSGAGGAASVTDFVIFGGSGLIDSTTNSAFQGYGTAIFRNSFDKIRKGAIFNGAANGIGFRENTVSLTCGDGTTKAITAATNGNPAILTATGHGFGVGDKIRLAISGATGNWAPINGATVTITVIDPNTFSVPVDSTLFGALTGAPVYPDGTFLEFAGSANYSTAGNYIAGNLVEMVNYAYFARMQNTLEPQFCMNNLFDAAAGNTVAFYKGISFATNGGMIINGYVDGGTPILVGAGRKALNVINGSASASTLDIQSQAITDTFYSGKNTYAAGAANGATNGIRSDAFTQFTWSGPANWDRGANSTSVATGDIVTAGGIGVGKDVTVGGVLTVQGLVSRFGVAGSAIQIFMPQTNTLGAIMNADGSNLVFRNSGAGALFFDSFGSGVTNFRSAGGATTQLSLASNGRATFAELIVDKAFTVGTLPAAAGLAGARAHVTDSNATLTAGIGAIVATGGANVVPVFCDGTNWRIG